MSPSRSRLSTVWLQVIARSQDHGYDRGGSLRSPSHSRLGFDPASLLRRLLASRIRRHRAGGCRPGRRNLGRAGPDRLLSRRRRAAPGPGPSRRRSGDGRARGRRASLAPDRGEARGAHPHPRRPRLAPPLRPHAAAHRPAHPLPGIHRGRLRGDAFLSSRGGRSFNRRRSPGPGPGALAPRRGARERDRLGGPPGEDPRGVARRGRALSAAQAPSGRGDGPGRGGRRIRLVRVRRDPREPERPGGDHHPALDGEVQGRNARGLRLRRPRPPSPARAREGPSRARPGGHRGRSRSAQSRRAPEGGEPAHGPEAQDAPQGGAGAGGPGPDRRGSPWRPRARDRAPFSRPGARRDRDPGRAHLGQGGHRPPRSRGRHAEGALFGPSRYNIGRRSPGQARSRAWWKRGWSTRIGPGGHTPASHRGAGSRRGSGRARRSRGREDIMRSGILGTETTGARRTRSGWAAGAAIFLLGAIALPGPARAQYFGQNKVQYKNFHWEVLRTEHFDVHYYRGEEEAVQDAAVMAERGYRRLSRVLDHQIKAKIPLVLYASHTDFEQTNITPELIGVGTGGVTEFLKRRVFLPFTGSYAELDHVLTHELVHAFQVDILFGDRMSLVGNPFSSSPPLWFMEGMAEYLSIAEIDNNTKMWLRDASLEGYLIPIRTLEYVGDIRVYRFGQSIFQFIADSYGIQKIGEILKRTRRMGSVDKALESATGLTVDVLSKKWMEAVRKEYLPQIADYDKPDQIATHLTDAERNESNFNVAPSVSPSGTQMVFISDRSMYNDVYLASALDGRIFKKLVEGERTGSFEVLRFFNTSFAWSPDETRISLPAQVGGQDAIYLIEIPSGKVKAKLKFGLDAIYSPTWSPDGKQLA